MDCDIVTEKADFAKRNSSYDLNSNYKKLRLKINYREEQPERIRLNCCNFMRFICIDTDINSIN